MQVLLVQNREDPAVIALKNAILNCGYSITCSRNIQETHEAIKKVNYDLVLIDCRRTHANTNKTHNTSANQYDYENICRFIRKLFHYTVIIALTHNYEDREVPCVLPFLKMGFNKAIAETTNLMRYKNDLLTLEHGEVSSVKRLQAAHTLFTALEYTSDPIEIMNEKFQLLYVNNAFEKLTGLSLNEVSGQSFHNLHKLDKNEILNKTEHVKAGMAWEFSLPIQKSTGEVSNHSSITIPIIVQGDTNKIQNYVTITKTSDKVALKNLKSKNVFKSNEPNDENTHPILKKITSLNIPKKSCDFERFADMIKSDSHTATSSIDDGTISDNEKQTDTSNDLTRSSPEFNPQLSTSSSNQFRKRSYDIQSTGNEFPSRRHSMAKVHQQSIEAPIRKVINIISLAHESSKTELVRQNLDKALDILRSTELYNPLLLDGDKHTSDLVSGLMSNGLQKRFAKGSIVGTKPLLNNESNSVQNYVRNLSPDIIQLLETEESWAFDIIALERLTNKRPLITLGLKTMNRFSVCQHLKISESMLVNWLTLMESNYKPSNPYHNSTHASDVLHATAYFLSTDKLTEILDDVDRCASAVLENHHAALAFQLTRQSQNANIFQNLTRDEYRAIRAVVIDMVLATEMNKHFEHLNKFVNKFSISTDEKLAIKSLDMLQLPENKILIKRILIKCADVSNPCRPLDIYKEWADRIASEYFQQTDEEKEKGLPVVMPTYDRAVCSIPKAQISFIEYFIEDMFEHWDEFVDLPEVMSNLQANTVYWRESAEDESDQSSQGSTEAFSKQNEAILINRNDSIKEDSELELESIDK
ncbi:high affinity cAMP-specific and IBMX-insensitive 3 -5 -cyclic phosphodiesterase 8A isoform X1 [Brachionus plicatilis]|uniref:3',5'-cyclic-AMP phosphodiesterase n=1 Tax=Brachionus plicatilis TaxID=10195 RepID=A0A3M7T0L6_BRAPC|nr:high affinity cAMP-specific and IBMX-insensitive 3 -5 -cyclic phosphodiesterase 8A isoform X1 [Brachionus plicatilis]